MSGFSWIDYSTLVVYLLGTVVIGLAIGRRFSTGSNYFLAGRRLRWWLIGTSLVATDIGGTDIIGVGGGPTAPARWRVFSAASGLRSSCSL